MFWNRFAFVFLAAACIAAAAGGGYLASRQNATTTPVAAAAASQAPAPSAAPMPVQETEAIVGDKAESPAKTSAASATAAPASSGAAKRSATPVEVEKKAPARAPARATTAAAADVNARLEAPQVPAPSAPSQATSTTPATFPQGQEASAAQTPRVDEPRAAVEPPHAPEPPAKTYDELVVSSDSVIGLQTENTVTSETARVEDRVDAHVTRDVRVGDRVAIPAGTRAIGSVTLVDRGGKFKERARLGIRFHTLVLADGTRVPISTETITRDGDAPTSAAKIGGGAVGGAILGAILGGAKGAVIGGATGAGAGAAAVAAGDRNNARLPAGAQATVRILAPVTVTVEK